MRRLFVVLIALNLISNVGFAQTLNGSFMHDGLLRSYITYVPTNYTGTKAVPLILNFHGFTGNGAQQFASTNFKPIADTAGFILVCPTGSKLPPANLNHWNVGGWTNTSTTDDVSFTSALIDSMVSKYNIDLMRIYATGMSNGGFFCHKLACELGHRIAAIASVAGTFTPQMQANCVPSHPTPVLQIHGTSDAVVPYNGTTGNGGMAAVDTVLDYWIQYNNCSPTPAISALPNINTTDGSTVEHIIYNGGDAGVTVEHFKVANGGHDWPGSSGNMDISASHEIWKFFSKYSNTAVGLNEEEKNANLLVYPNPTSESVYLNNLYAKRRSYTIYSMLGEQVSSGVLEPNVMKIDLNDLDAGIYFLSIDRQVYRVVKLD